MRHFMEKVPNNPTKPNKRMQPTLNPSVTYPAEQDARLQAGG